MSQGDRRHPQKPASSLQTPQPFCPQAQDKRHASHAQQTNRRANALPRAISTFPFHCVYN